MYLSGNAKSLSAGSDHDEGGIAKFLMAILNNDGNPDSLTFQYSMDYRTYYYMYMAQECTCGYQCLMSQTGVYSWIVHM